MADSQKFYLCKHCGNLVGLIVNKGVPLVCCGEKMQELQANSVDASVEKHTPVVSVEGNTIRVEVGSVAHPMTEEHYIKFVYLQTENGGQRKSLCSQGSPNVEFALTKDEKPIAVFAYCNLHGLWKYHIEKV